MDVWEGGKNKNKEKLIYVNHDCITAKVGVLWTKNAMRHKTEEE